MIVCGILRARPEWNQSRLSALYCVSPASGETGMRKYFCTRKASAFVVVKQACLRAANTNGCMFKELELLKGVFLCFILFKGGGLMKTNHLELQGRRIEHRLDQSLPLALRANANIYSLELSSHSSSSQTPWDQCVRM